MVALVGLDILAAFDIVIPNTLLNRLEHEFGITAVPLNWIDSYLSGRTVSVSIGKSTSAAVPVSSGVPQGSVLGTILLVDSLTVME